MKQKLLCWKAEPSLILPLGLSDTLIIKSLLTFTSLSCKISYWKSVYKAFIYVAIPHKERNNYVTLRFKFC